MSLKADHCCGSSLEGTSNQRQRDQHGQGQLEEGFRLEWLCRDHTGDTRVFLKLQLISVQETCDPRSMFLNPPIFSEFSLSGNYQKQEMQRA